MAQGVVQERVQEAVQEVDEVLQEVVPAGAQEAKDAADGTI